MSEKPKPLSSKSVDGYLWAVTEGGMPVTAERLRVAFAKLERERELAGGNTGMLEMQIDDLTKERTIMRLRLDHLAVVRNDMRDMCDAMFPAVKAAMEWREQWSASEASPYPLLAAVRDFKEVNPKLAKRITEKKP